MDHRWYEDPSNREPTWTKHFPVVGQGTVFFNITRGTKFAIVVKPTGKEVPTWQWIALEIYKDKAVFLLGRPNSKPKVLETTIPGQEDVGFDADEKTSYWLSFDRDRLIVKYGKGYCMEETTLLVHRFLTGSAKENEKTREEMAYLFNPVTKKAIEFYDYKPFEELERIYAAQHLILRKPLGNIDEIDFDVPKPVIQKLHTTSKGKEARAKAKSIIDVESKVSFSRYPLVQNWPHLVLDSNKLSLFDLDQNKFIFSASLPPACQELYANVARGENIGLDWPPHIGEPKLSDAIRYSIKTKGKILYNKLKEKSDEFGESNPLETYLRVTLGMYRGNSPGIPYVLEIWPHQHYSPIHDHGNAYAVIKVVHGSINVHVHNKKVKTDDQKPLKKVTISKGDVTWISPNWYQTHRLINDTSGDYCATIQCYQYGDDDQRHWPYFDYVSEQNQIEDFLPNSDFHFISLREKLLEEYKAYLNEK